MSTANLIWFRSKVAMLSMEAESRQTENVLINASVKYGERIFKNNQIRAKFYEKSNSINCLGNKINNCIANCESSNVRC